MEKYDEIIKEQLKDGVVDRVTESAHGREFYLSLQNLLWNVLMRNRFYSVSIAGDLMKAFWHIRSRENERRLAISLVQRSSRPESLKFSDSPGPFSSRPIPIPLGWSDQTTPWKLPRQIPRTDRRDTKKHVCWRPDWGRNDYNGSSDVERNGENRILEAKFQMHKWHSNETSLETENEPTGEQSYAKTQLGVKGESKLLGPPWNKVGVEFWKREVVATTKRGVLSSIARIYDPLGVVSPTSLNGKLLHREICDRKIPWDKEPPPDLLTKWSAWRIELPEKVEIPRSLVNYRKEINHLGLVRPW